MTDPGSPPPVPPGALASSPLGQSPVDAVPTGGDDRLATAFTRIVGEQLNEQREISALLSDLRARLASLDGLTQEMDASVARRVATVATEVRAALESRGDPDDARREAEAAREQIVAARSQVYELSSSLGASIEGIEAELAGLTPAVSGLGPLLSALGPRLEELYAAVETLQAGVSELQTELAGVQSDVSGLPAAGSLDELSDGLAGMRTDLRSLPEQIGGAVGGRIAESLDLIRDSVRAVLAELSALQAAVGETSEPDPLMTEVEAQLAGVASRVSALGGLPEQLEGLSTDLGAVWQAVQVLDDKLGALPTDEDLVPSVAAAGAAVVVLEGTIQALDARVEAFIASSDVGPDPELAHVSDAVVAVGVSVAEIRTTLSEVGGRVDELARRPVDDSGLRQLAVDVAAVDTALAALDARLAAVDVALAAVDSKVDAIDTRLAGADDDVEVGPVLDGLAAALAGVAGGVDDLDAKLDERLAALAGRVEEVRAQTVPLPVPEPAPAPEDLALAPLAELSESVTVVGTGVAALSESLAGMGLDLVDLSARLAQLEARGAQGGTPISASDLTMLTGPLTGEVAGLRGDLDNVRRLLLEDLPDDAIDTAQLAADIDAALSPAVGAQVSETVSQHLVGVLQTAVSEAVQRAVADAVGPAVNHAVSEAVGPAVSEAVGPAVIEAVAQSVDDAVARSLRTSVEDAVRITVSPTLAHAVDTAVDRAAGQQVELESRLRSHVDEAVMALAEIVLNTPNLAIPHTTATPARVSAAAPVAGPVAGPVASAAAPTTEPPEPTAAPAEDGDADAAEKKRRFGRK